jgi:serine/threonine protein phosphatase 1
MKEERYIAIGDIHGCKDQLLELLEKTGTYPEHKLVFLGDYIDRGPDSEGVIEVLSQLDAIFILGNHEQSVLETTNSLIDKPGLYQTYLEKKKLSEESIQWIQKNPVPYFETDSYIFSHAGLNPTKKLEEQTLKDYLLSFHETDYYAITEKLVIHGHIAEKEVQFVGNNVSVDTACSFGGYLSAIVLPSREILQSKTKSENYFRKMLLSLR